MKHSNVNALLSKAKGIVRSFAGSNAELLATMRAAGYEAFADALQSRLDRYGDYRPDSMTLGRGLYVAVNVRGSIPNEGDSDETQVSLASTWTPTAALCFQGEGEPLLRVKRTSINAAFDAAASIANAVRNSADPRYIMADVNKALVANAPMYADDSAEPDPFTPDFKLRDATLNPNIIQAFDAHAL